MFTGLPQRMGGQGDNRQMLTTLLFTFTDHPCGLHTIHNRHLNIHQGHIKLTLLPVMQQLTAITCLGNGMAVA